MGLLEQLNAGAVLDRQSISFTVDAAGSGSFAIGSAAILLNIANSQACRLRLYDDVASRDNASEINRSFITSSVEQNIALVADISMSAVGEYAIDPTLYSVSEDKNLYYRIDEIGNTPTIRITSFLLEDDSVVLPNPSKRTLTSISALLGPGELSSGSLTTAPETPKIFLLVSASLDSGDFARIRLYNKFSSIEDSSEKSRPFSTEPSASVGLIVDAVITGSIGSGILHFSPKIVGVNLNNLQTDLLDTQVDGQNEMYYILQNASSSGAPVTITTSLHIFAIED
jgi:hypothetical protein